MPFLVWKAAPCKDTTSEAWYDAEEDLEPAGPASAAETGQDQTESTEAKSSGRWLVNVAGALQLQM